MPWVVDEVAGDRILWTAWSASAVLLKCQTDAAAPKHMARWNQRVTPAGPATKVPECDEPDGPLWGGVVEETRPTVSRRQFAELLLDVRRYDVGLLGVARGEPGFGLSWSSSAGVVEHGSFSQLR